MDGGNDENKWKEVFLFECSVQIFRDPWNILEGKLHYTLSLVRPYPHTLDVLTYSMPPALKVSFTIVKSISDI